MRLYRDVTAYNNNLLGIEAVSNGAHDLSIEGNPAELQSVNDSNQYVIYFVNELNRHEWIMAIGHELGHLLLINKYYLKIDPLLYMLVNDEEILQTIQNVTHHLILVDLLREEYGIHTDLHLRLIRRNLGEYLSDTELMQETKALRVFEYEKLVARMEEAVTAGTQVKSFQKAYASAGIRFASYSFKDVPTSNEYKEDVLSFLKDIGRIRQGM
jgi:hypothetical protein